MFVQVDNERAERMRLEHAVKTGSLPDDAKMGVANMGNSVFADAQKRFVAGRSEKSGHLN